jgi:hypothetical protein
VPRIGCSQKVSTITTLRDKKHEATAAKIILGGIMTKNAVAALSDEFSRRVLISTVAEGKTVQDISLEQAVPLSTCYRRARKLVDQGLLVVERIVLTRNGTRYVVYRNSLRTIEMSLDFRGLSASAELNEDVADKFRRRWFYTSYPSRRQGIEKPETIPTS